jgi:hypothetical protein
MVAPVDLRLVRLVHQVEEERQKRIRTEHEMRGLRSQLNQTKRRLAAVLTRTTDSAKPPPNPD